MDEIDLLQKSDDVDKHKKIFARMLNLARPAQSAVAVEPVKIQQAHPQSTTQQVLANALGVYITIGQINYSEATYSGISHLFSDTSSPQAITTGAIAALFSLLPNVGFGFYTGTKTANAVMTDNVPLAKLYMSKTREILKYTIDFISLFAGGTTMAVAMDASADYVTLTHMKETLSAILKVSQGLVAYTGGAIVDAYYTQRLCDEILIYLAQRCGDENTKRLFTFVLETRRLHKILWETNEENYLELLTWKMEGNTELSDLMHIVFDNRMSDGQYNKTQQDLNKISKVMKDRIQLPHYQVIPSFFAKEAEEMQQRHPGLRHRVCGLFSRCKNQDGSRDIESHGVEMQQRR
jgi:hypothetical protein